MYCLTSRHSSVIILQVFSIFYNDEFPYPNNNTASGSSGHTKGIWMYNYEITFDMIRQFLSASLYSLIKI